MAVVVKALLATICLAVAGCAREVLQAGQTTDDIIAGQSFHPS